ncbi:hypothetical protein KSS87_015629 [Heliosperma pusillum]|nr:hypothetical protein KSS87_015629 [Heliosperma pusillum]
MGRREIKSKKASEKSESEKGKSRAQVKMSKGERSAYFGRREAAKILCKVLQGDARRRATASIKSLVFCPTVRNKKATFALLCQTLKYLPLIKDILDTSAVLNAKWKDISSCGSGTAEKFLLLSKASLLSALAKILVRNKVKEVEDLLSQYHTPDVPKPRYVRVNTLKLDVNSAINELGRKCTVENDDLVPDLLVLPPGVDLHDHPLVTNGSVFLQGKASSMVAVALGPQPGWEVSCNLILFLQLVEFLLAWFGRGSWLDDTLYGTLLPHYELICNTSFLKVLDACSAPGNKTVHLAALMRGKGKIVAFELSADRVKLLQNTVKLAGASNQTGDSDIIRLTKLAAFQKKALEHALSFPSVERIVYSTCSIHQIENEDVIKSVLPMALKNGFQLATPFPQFPRRGLPVFEGSEHLLRMDPTEDKEGFFIALFTRKNLDEEQSQTRNAASELNQVRVSNKRKAAGILPYTRLSKMWMLSRICSLRTEKNTRT